MEVAFDRAAPDSQRREQAVLCIFIFLLSLKPSEPHLTAYLESRGFARSAVNDSIYPVWTYAYFPMIMLVTPLVEASGAYTACIVLGSLARVGTRALLLSASSVASLQLAEVLYAGGSVAEVIFYSFLFRVIQPARYGETMAGVQASYLLGHVVSGVGGDLLLDYGRASLSSLLWVSAAAVTAAAVTAVLCFPCLDAAARTHPEAREATVGGASLYKRAWERSAAGVRILARTATQREAAVAAALWVVGYAAYQLVWGYETSLYSALAGGGSGRATSWNGSVLGAALLAGTVAASASGSRYTARLRTSMRACAQLLAGGAVFSAATLLALYLAAVPLRAPAAALGAFIVYSALWQFQEVAFRVAIARRVEEVAMEQQPNAVGLLEWLRGERDAPPQCVGEESREGLEVAGDEELKGTRRAPFALAFSSLVAVSLAVQTVLQWALFSRGGLSAAAAYGALAALLAVSAVVAGGLWIALSRRGRAPSAA